MMRLFAGFFALLLLSAAAGPMMPAGPSPESGLAGVWRVVAAKPAPWTKPRTLTKKDAPLLEYAVEFADNEVKGPASLACKGARYSSGVSYQNELFGGKLAADKDGSLTKKIALSDSGATTYRVLCGQTARDFYVDNNYALVMAQGDVVYTLQRPDSGDQSTAGFSGPSFDCTKAKTTGEQLICNDAALAKADRTLSKAYSALRKTETAESFATIKTAQRAWLAYAMKSCGVEGPMPDAGGDRNRMTDCLTPEYNARTDLLKDLTVEKAGTLTLEPRMRFRTRAAPDTADTDIYPWMNGGPQAAAFNAFVFKALALGQWRTNDKQTFHAGEDMGEMRLYARRTYTTARFDGRIVSLLVSSDDFTGGNHDALDQSALTWDLAKGRRVMLGDVFAKGQDWKNFAFATCKKDLHEQMQERGAPDLDAAQIRAVVANEGSWLWSADKARVIFMVDTIGGLPGGAFEVEIPLKALRPFMTPDSPVR